MKNSFLNWGWVLLAASMSWTASASEDVSVHFKKLYVPEGFDSNDNNVQIVAEGELPNTCYRTGEMKFRISRATKKIYVRAKARRYAGTCLPMTVPFRKVYNLGVLPAGTYDVIQFGRGRLGQFTVKPAVIPSADDHPYAPVEQAYLEKVDGFHQVRVSGVFTSDCFVMDELKVDHQEDVIVVRPISKRLNRSICTDGLYPYEARAVIDDLDESRYLLHVRSLNSNAVNSLVDTY